MRLAVSLLCSATALLAATSASSTPQRFAVFIAAHDGGQGLPRLRYAERDALRLADVLAQVGGFSRADMLTVVDGDDDAVRDALVALRRRVEVARSSGEETVALVYYSGHAQDGQLRLGDDTVAMSEVRSLLEDSGADVRLAFIDACGAGAMTREKGATLAAPFVVKVDDALQATGQVIIASSSRDEVSQESDEIQGSFFTHALTTGLRGDADADHDGQVTLDEAYAYAYGRTVAATASTRAGAQHPTYDFDLNGRGDVVLTTPGGADVVVHFPGELEGRFFVVDLERQLFVAEVDKARGGSSTIALSTGQYAIKKRLDSHLLMTRVHARSKGTIVVDERTMEVVSFSDDYAKGSPIAAVTARIDPPVGFSFSVGAAASAIVAGDGVDDGGLFPAVGSLQAKARFHHLLRSQLTLDVDLAGGGTRSTRVVDGGSLGVARFDVDVRQWAAGGAILWEQPLADLVGVDGITVLMGPRLSGVLWTHTFVGELRPAGLTGQTYLTFAPGLETAIAWSATSWAHLEVGGRAMYIPYTVDRLRHLALLEGFAAVWLDL
jgi:hypothetical protein